MRTIDAADWMYGAPEPKRHPLAAVLALLFSALIHGFLLLNLPPLSIMTLPRDWVSPPPASPPFHIEDIRQTPPAPRPTSPDATREEGMVAEAFQPLAPGVEHRTVDPILAALPDPVPELEGQHTALAGPAPRPRPAPRQTRLQQLEITRQIVPDRQAALPRRIAPRIQRTRAAPDITLPDEPAASAMGEGIDPFSDPGDAAEPVLARPDPDGRHASAVRGHGEPGTGTGRLRSGLAGAAVERMMRGMEPLRRVEPADHYLSFHTHVYRPEEEPGILYFRVEFRRSGADALPVLPRDILLVQDCSESMTQPLLDQCKAGLRAWLQTLSPEDRFDLVTFRETQDRCFGQWAPVTATTRARAQWFIEHLAARGRTDIHSSLERLLDMPRTPGRPMLVVFITDGIPTTGVLDESAILEQFTRRNAGAVSVFPFGAGARINRFLLDFLGFKNRGDTFFVESFQAVPSGLQHMAQEIRRPVLADLTYQVTGLPAEELYPRTLTHLFLDRPLVVFGRARIGSDPAGLRIVGQSATQTHDIVHALRWDEAESAGPEIRAEWARRKAYHLIGEHAATGDPEILDRLRALTRRAGIRTPYTDALSRPSVP